MSEIKREQLLMAVIAGRGPAYLRGINISSIDLSGAGWLLEADLRHADLSNANLRRANLRGANLEKANLHSAILSSANLEGANLFRVKADVSNLNMCKLRGANLKEANLVSANMVRADLEEADLEGADLEGANLQGANLRKARITNVNLKMANLDGADLTEAIMDGPFSPGKSSPGQEHRDFHGTITAIKLTDLIQVGCLSRSCMNIEVFTSEERGNIYIGSGRILHAYAGNIEGEEAFLKILEWDNGRFITYPYIPSGVATINKPVEHLMIQSLRLRDEKRSAGRYSTVVRKMKEHMPVIALASEDLISLFQMNGKNLPPSEKIEVTDVFYPDEGEEILCSISAQGEILIAPVKLVTFEKNHPLNRELAKIK
ncbi:MAG: pentapeptide repeat-containing protein [Syntrophobacteraceae bacterium]